MIWLAQVRHPNIVPLRYAFASKTKLYLVLDFVNGGHLFFQVRLLSQDRPAPSTLDPSEAGSGV